jgi:hypothetical protein
MSAGSAHRTGGVDDLGSTVTGWQHRQVLTGQLAWGSRGEHGVRGDGEAGPPFAAGNAATGPATLERLSKRGR